MSHDTNLDLIIVGAGPSGLAFALGARDAAAQAGQPLRLAVLEASQQVGGWVHTRSEGGYLLETGPYGYLDKHPELGRIVSRLGLEAEARLPSDAAVNRFVLARGRLRRMPTGPLSFLLSRILTFRGKLRLLQEPWAAGHPGGDESVAAFATRRLGPEAAETLVVPMFTGIYAGDPDRSSLASCFPRMAELERDHGGLFRALWRLRKAVKQAGQGVGAPRGKLTSFAGGLGTLMAALGRTLAADVRLGAEVTAVERTTEGYRVRLADGEDLAARQVVLALPARRAVAVTAGLAPGLSERIARIPYTGVAVVHTAHAVDDARRMPRGFGFLVPRQAARPLLGSVFVSHVFPEHAPGGEVLLRNVLGGALRPDLLAQDDEALLGLVREEHRSVLGITAAPRFVEVVRYPESLPQYRVGHGALLGEIDAAAAALPGLHLTGNAYRGIGLADCLAQNLSRGEALGAALGATR
jgi:oxygen-dependent protoporphyrinogen oxidase